MARGARDHNTTVHAIYEAAADPDRWSEMLVTVADHVGALGGMLAYHAPTGSGQPSFLLVGRLRPDIGELYLQHYVDNPFARASMSRPIGRVVVGSHIVDLANVRRLSFHTDILAPQAIEDFVIFTHASLTRRGSVGGVSFPLQARHAAAAETAAARMRRLAPHMTRAIDLTLQLGRQRSGAWQFERILEALPNAALLVDGRCRILIANAHAEALLRQADGLFTTNGDGLRLAAQSRDEARLLSAAVAAAVVVAHGEERPLAGPMRVTRPSGRPPLLVLTTPLPAPAFSLWEAVDGGARALVQIIDLETPVAAQAEALRAAVGLTVAEARVAAQIAAGASAVEAAAALGISLTTVKTHLGRCFDKTGVRSQVGLARLVASIPVPARPPGRPDGRAPEGDT